MRHRKSLRASGLDIHCGPSLKFRPLGPPIFWMRTQHGTCRLIVNLVRGCPLPSLVLGRRRPRNDSHIGTPYASDRSGTA